MVHPRIGRLPGNYRLGREKAAMGFVLAQLLTPTGQDLPGSWRWQRSALKSSSGGTFGSW